MTDSIITSFEAENTNNGGQFAPQMAPTTMLSATTTVSATVFSVWDGDWALLEEYDASGQLLEAYVQGAHGLVKTIIQNVYYYQDSLGSTSHVANSSGTLKESYRYRLSGTPNYFDEFGNPKGGSTFGVQDLFAGGRYMPVLGLYDLRNRFMSPARGVFLQPDPIGFAGDASNLYRYCGNNWANHIDRLGLLTPQQAANYQPEKGQQLGASGGGSQPRGATMGGAAQEIAKRQVNMSAAVSAHHVEVVAASKASAAAGVRASIMKQLSKSNISMGPSTARTVPTGGRTGNRPPSARFKNDQAKRGDEYRGIDRDGFELRPEYVQRPDYAIRQVPDAPEQFDMDAWGVLFRNLDNLFYYGSKDLRSLFPPTTAPSIDLTNIPSPPEQSMSFPTPIPGPAPTPR